jgi:non-specific serine/threonine protein kinase
MLETVREFGVERLTASGELDVVLRWHAEYFSGFAARAEPELTGADQFVWFGRLERDHANLRMALDWTIGHNPAIGLEMAAALIRFWDHRSHVRDGQRWLEAALSASGDLSPSLRAKALWGAGVLADSAGDYERAENSLVESLTLAKLAGDGYVTGFALGALGTVALHHGDLERAATLAEEGLAHQRAVGDTDAIAALLGNLGSIAFFQGDYAKAMTHAEESLALYRSLGSVHGTASVLSHVGRALLELGDYERAEAMLSEGLLLSWQVGNKWYTIAALEGLAGTATARGEWERAARLFGAVEAIAKANGVAVHPADRATNERYIATIRSHLDGATFARAGDVESAVSLEQVISEALKKTSPVVNAPVAPDPAVTAGLTGRELDVLRLLAQGLSDRDIAAMLFLSPRTIGGHITNLLSKLELDSRTAAAVFAVRHGLA